MEENQSTHGFLVLVVAKGVLAHLDKVLASGVYRTV